MDHVPGPASSATAWERLFLECDKQGRVLWMNRRARLRLGSVESLFAALPTQHLADVSRLLQSATQGRRWVLFSSLQSADRPARIPVQLVRLLALEDRVVLSAEVRARASDRLPPQHEILRVLLAMQSNATRNYFRLRELEGSLAALCRPSRSTGMIVSQALEMERTRIARELHSGAGQTLAAIKVNLDLIASRMPEPPELIRGSLQRIRTLADEGLSEIRAVSQRLHPPNWKQMDLPQAIEWLWTITGVPEKFHATLELHPVESDLPDALRFAIYRAAQEGLANVLHHSGATQVKLQLGSRDGQIYLVLEDNGSGFDVQELLEGSLAPAMRGIGLRAMRDEVAGLAGHFDLRSSSDGTRMEITIPIAENR